MTDIRTRLADALRGFPVDLGPLYPPCRLVQKDREDIADVLLSLPGIAIVDVGEVRAHITEGLNAKYRDDTITAADEFAAMTVNRLLDSLAAANAAEAAP